MAERVREAAVKAQKVHIWSSSGKHTQCGLTRTPDLLGMFTLTGATLMSDKKNSGPCKKCRNSVLAGPHEEIV